MTDLTQVNLTPKNLEEALETIGHLAKIIIALKEENARLKEQLNINSKNSSLPHHETLKRKSRIARRVVEHVEANWDIKDISAA